MPATVDAISSAPRSRPPRQRWACALAACLLGPALTACFDYDDAVSPTGSKPSNRPDTSLRPDDATGRLTTWHQHVRPLVESHCADCHAPGLIGAMPLDTFAATAGVRDRMVSSVNQAVGDGDALPMPPWPMDPTCREVQVHDARLLSAAQKAVFTAWAASGYAEGDPSTYLAPPARPDPGLGDPQFTLTRTTGYTPRSTSPDDFRCFLFDQTFATDRWITAVDIVPDRSEMVRHVLLLVIPPSEVSKIETKDATTPGPGFDCVGGTGAVDEAVIGGWVPGMQPIAFPTGSALRIRAGSRLVAQIHYNTANIAAGSTVPEDKTGARLWAIAAVGQLPEAEIRIRPIADRDLAIPKDDADAVAGTTVPMPYSAQVIGVIPHMHQLGTSLKLEVERGAAGNRDCLAHIPQWDFRWQQTYIFSDAGKLSLSVRDKLHLACVYDNSPSNQALVNGVQRPSQSVGWGEGAFDEQCLAYVVTRTTRHTDTRYGDLCDGFRACFNACDLNNAWCTLDCLSLASLECVACAAEPIFDACALATHCIAQRNAMTTCRAARCADGSFVDCVLGECGAEFDVLHSCVQPALASGACNDEAVECGIGPIAD